MSRYLLLLVLFCLTVTPAAAEEVYSGTLVKSSQSIDVDKEVIRGFQAGFSGDNMSIRIEEVNRTAEDLQIFRAYRLETSGEGNLYGLNMTLNLSEWFNSSGVEEYETSVFTGEELEINSIQQEDSLHRTYVEQPQEYLYIGRMVDNYGENREEGNTTQKEDKTSVALELPENLPLIGAICLVLLALSAASIWLQRRRKGSKVAQLTEELIQEMKHGDLEKDPELLERLEEANELAYDGEYAEANQILEQVKKELKRR